MRARRSTVSWLLVFASALSVPALALAISMVVALADASPAPTPGGNATPAPLAGSTPVPGATPSNSNQALGPGLPGDPSKGQQLFGQDCATCHGASLTGGIGPRLNPIAHLGNTKNPLDPTYLIGVITNGLKGVPCSDFNCSSTTMPPKGGANLTDTDVHDLAAFLIQQNKTGGTEAALDPRALAVENVKWVTIGILVMLILTWLLARYNMRWIDRRVAARRERLERQGRQ